MSFLRSSAVLRSPSYLALLYSLLLSGQVSAQNFEWIRRFGTERDEQANAVAQASSGIYTVGNTIGIFPGQPSAGPNDVDAFVVRYDTFGEMQWLRQFGSTAVANDVATGVAADATGVYVVGWTNGTLPGQTSSGGADIFVRKYDVNGEVVWTRQFGDTSDDEASAAAMDEGGVYVAGWTTGTLPGQTALGGRDAFVRKYDRNGTVLWTRQFGTGNADEALGLAVYDSHVYITGRTGGDLARVAQGFDIFLRQYGADGTEGWTSQFGTDTTDQGNAVAADASGIYVVGDTTGTFAGQAKVGGLWDEFAAGYDFAGNQRWVRQFGTHFEDSASGVAVNFDGVFVVGFNDGEALPGTNPQGGWDAYVRLYDMNGTEISTNQFGSNGNDWAFGVAADDSGVYICGYFSGSAEGFGGNDAFLLKIPGQPALSFAQFVTGILNVPNRTRVILLNNSDEGDSGMLQFIDGQGEPTPVLIGGIPTSVVDYDLGPWSTTEVVTDGTEAAIKSGVITLQSNRGTGSRVEGTEAFELLGYFVSVASSPPQTAGQVYVSVTGTEDTGVALYNPGKQNPVTVRIALSDNKDQQLGEKDIVVEPGKQVVAFVDDATLFAAVLAGFEGDFQGRLKLTSLDAKPFSLLGLLQKSLTGALIAVSAEAEGDPGRLIFAQFANGLLGVAAGLEGLQAGLPNRTRLVLLNDGEETDSGTVRFQDASGELTDVPIEGESQSTVPYSLDPGTSTEVETDGTGPLQTGVIEVSSSLDSASRILGSEVFEILGNFVSVLNSPPRASQQAYVSVTDDEDTGVALYNPDPDDPVTLTLILLDSGGAERARKNVILEANQQLVQFVDQSELFQDFFAGLGEDFKGTLNIHAEEGRKAAVLGILQRRATGALIAVKTSPNAFGEPD